MGSVLTSGEKLTKVLARPLMAYSVEKLQIWEAPVFC